MGISVFSGMMMATVVGVVLVPMLFVLVEKIAGRGKAAQSKSAEGQTREREVVHG
jgi:hypothetical protein